MLFVSPFYCLFYATCNIDIRYSLWQLAISIFCKGWQSTQPRYYHKGLIDKWKWLVGKYFADYKEEPVKSFADSPEIHCNYPMKAIYAHYEF